MCEKFIKIPSLSWPNIDATQSEDSKLVASLKHFFIKKKHCTGGKHLQNFRLRRSMHNKFPINILVWLFSKDIYSDFSPPEGRKFFSGDFQKKMNFQPKVKKKTGSKVELVAGGTVYWCFVLPE